MWFKNKIYILAMAGMFVSNVWSTQGAQEEEEEVNISDILKTVQSGTRGAFTKNTVLDSGIGTPELFCKFNKKKNTITIEADMLNLGHTHSDTGMDQAILTAYPYLIKMLTVSGDGLIQLCNLCVEEKDAQPLLIQFKRTTGNVDRYIFDSSLDITRFARGKGSYLHLSTYKIGTPKDLENLLNATYRTSKAELLTVQSGQLECVKGDEYSKINLENPELKSSLLSIAKKPSESPVVVEKIATVNLLFANVYFKYRFIISWGNNGARNSQDAFIVSTSCVFIPPNDLGSMTDFFDQATRALKQDYLKIYSLPQGRVLIDRFAQNAGFTSNNDYLQLTQEEFEKKKYDKLDRNGTQFDKYNKSIQTMSAEMRRNIGG